MAKFHYLARAVIFSGERVLLAHEIGAESTFLPGGHIGYGEPAKTALIREIKEETGVEVSVGRFLGAVEATWHQGEELHSEINLIFEAFSSEITHEKLIMSTEDHLEFIWVERMQVKSYNLLPETMQSLIENLSDENHAFWGSMLGEEPPT